MVLLTLVTLVNVNCAARLNTGNTGIVMYVLLCAGFRGRACHAAARLSGGETPLDFRPVRRGQGGGVYCVL